MKVFVDGVELPEGGIDPDYVRFDEAELVERATGKTWGECLDEFRRGGIVPLRALCWIGMRRLDPNVKLEDVNPRMVDFTMVPDSADEADPTPDAPGPVEDGASPAQTTPPESEGLSEDF